MADIIVGGETAAREDLTAHVGADWPYQYTFYQADGVTPYDLTNKTLRMEIRRSMGGASLKTFVTGAGIVVSGASHNIATLSANFDGFRSYLAFYDLWEKDNTSSLWQMRAYGGYLLKPSMTVTT